MISKSNVKCTDSNVKFADSKVRMTSWFASSTQQEIEKLLEDKDLENTKRSTKVAKELFYEYLNKREKYPGATRQKGVSPSVEIFLCGSTKKGWIVFVVIFFKTMYNKTIIRFGFCDIQNNVYYYYFNNSLLSGLKFLTVDFLLLVEKWALTDVWYIWSLVWGILTQRKNNLIAIKNNLWQKKTENVCE